MQYSTENDTFFDFSDKIWVDPHNFGKKWLKISFIELQ